MSWGEVVEYGAAGAFLSLMAFVVWFEHDTRRRK